MTPSGRGAKQIAAIMLERRGELNHTLVLEGAKQVTIVSPLLLAASVYSFLTVAQRRE